MAHETNSADPEAIACIRGVGRNGLAPKVGFVSVRVAFIPSYVEKKAPEEGNVAVTVELAIVDREWPAGSTDR